MGSGVGTSANKTTGVSIDLSNPANEYCLSYDLFKNYWGIQVGLGADLDINSNITKNDPNEHALVLETGNSYANQTILRLPGGTTLTASSGIIPGDTWSKIKIIFKGNNVTVKYSTDNGVTWFDIWTNEPMGINLSAPDKSNAYRWDNIYIHIEGAVGKLDNILLEKIN